MADKVGRPRIFNSPEEFNAKVEEYKAHCIDSEDTPTLTGMILFMGFSAKESFYQYQEYDGYSDSVKKARLWIESLYEKDLRERGHSGTIFGLKNMGWSDKQEIEHSINNDSYEKLKDLYK